MAAFVNQNPRVANIETNFGKSMYRQIGVLSMVASLPGGVSIAVIGALNLKAYAALTPHKRLRTRGGCI
jgi:hypothetical protein